MKLHELHNKLFDVLCVIDDICKKNHVRYFLDGGTELGAVREHDFIAWDDDMDIKVLREDYPAFKAAMEKDLPPYMHIIEPEAFAPHFFDFAVRIYDERFMLRKQTEEDKYYNNYQNYVGTDVFIFDRMPKSSLLRALTVFKMKCLYGLGMAHRYKIDFSSYSTVMKVQAKVLATVGKLFSAKSICKMYRKVTSSYSNDVSAPYRMPTNGPLAKIWLLEDSWFNGETDGYIRGRRFPIISGYDAWLTLHYGDYMKPPADRSIYIQHLDPEDRYENNQ